MSNSLAKMIVAIGLAGVIWLTYGAWKSKGSGGPSYTIQYANLDLVHAVGKGAVLTGGFGAALCQIEESPLSYPFMFHGEPPDDFWLLPITHVAVEIKEDQPFFTIYPEIAQRATLVTVYPIRGLAVGIYRVVGSFFHPRSLNYELSDLENIQNWMLDNPTQGRLDRLPELIEEHCDTYSGWRFVAAAHTRLNQSEESDKYYAAAIRKFEGGQP